MKLKMGTYFIPDVPSAVRLDKQNSHIDSLLASWLQTKASNFLSKIHDVNVTASNLFDETDTILHFVYVSVQLWVVSVILVMFSSISSITLPETARMSFSHSGKANLKRIIPRILTSSNPPVPSLKFH